MRARTRIALFALMASFAGAPLLSACATTPKACESFCAADANATKCTQCVADEKAKQEQARRKAEEERRRNPPPPSYPSGGGGSMY